MFWESLDVEQNLFLRRENQLSRTAYSVWLDFYFFFAPTHPGFRTDTSML